MMEEQCFICSQSASQQCDECGEVSMCGAHLDYHRDPVSGLCFPFRVSAMEGVGRVLLAARDLSQGELVFREREVVVGPAKTTPPVCLGCGGLVTGEVRCQGCRWPLCSSSCPGSLHTSEECSVIADKGPLDEECGKEAGDCPRYQAIAPLRALLLPPDQLSYLLMFMDHNTEREVTGVQEHVVRRLREEWGQVQYSEELILRVEGILAVNSVEHRVSSSPSSRCFLPITSLASHSCTSNSFKDKSQPGWVLTRAKSSVPAGSELTFHYAGGLRGRLARREQLATNWHFNCNCQRCSSPSELGAELSSLLCPLPCPGVLRPVDPLDRESDYRCSECDLLEDCPSVLALEAGLTSRIESLYDTDTPAIQQLLDTGCERFHPRHYLVLILKWLLISSWGRVKGVMYRDLSEATLEKKLVLCRDYLGALAVVDGGVSHNTGVTAWELQSASMYLLNKRFKEEKLSPLKFVEGLKEGRLLCETAVSHLQYYSEEEGDQSRLEMARQAAIAIQQAITFFTKQLGL